MGQREHMGNLHLIKLLWPNCWFGPWLKRLHQRWPLFCLPAFMCCWISQKFRFLISPLSISYPWLFSLIDLSTLYHNWSSKLFEKNYLPLETAGKSRIVSILPFQQLNNMEWPLSDLEYLQVSNSEGNVLNTCWSLFLSKNALPQVKEVKKSQMTRLFHSTTRFQHLVSHLSLEWQVYQQEIW